MNPKNTSLAGPGAPPFRPRDRAWPVLAALALVLIGSGLLAASAALTHEARLNAGRSTELQLELQRSSKLRSLPVANTGASLDLPPYFTHLSDVEQLVQVAGRQEVKLSALNIRTEHPEKLPLVLRVLEIRIDEEYPRLKTFVSELLARLPHLYLDEIRIEQASESSGKVQASLKFSLVYRSSAMPAGGDKSLKASQ
jgi:hypothetical protein